MGMIGMMGYDGARLGVRVPSAMRLVIPSEARKLWL